MSSIRYSVIICPRCSSPKIADLRVKTTICNSCGKSMIIKKMRFYGNADTPQELHSIIGDLNRKRANIHLILREPESTDPAVSGEEDTFTNTKSLVFEKGAISDRSQLKPGHQTGKIEQIREELSKLDEFRIEDFEEAVSVVGWKREKAVTLLRRLMESGDVFSPKRGSFKFVK